LGKAIVADLGPQPIRESYALPARYSGSLLISVRRVRVVYAVLYTCLRPLQFVCPSRRSHHHGSERSRSYAANMRQSRRALNRTGVSQKALMARDVQWQPRLKVQNDVTHYLAGYCSIHRAYDIVRLQQPLRSGAAYRGWSRNWRRRRCSTRRSGGWLARCRYRRIGRRGTGSNYRGGDDATPAARLFCATTSGSHVHA